MFMFHSYCARGEGNKQETRKVNVNKTGMKVPRFLVVSARGCCLSTTNQRHPLLSITTSSYLKSWCLRRTRSAERVLFWDALLLYSRKVNLCPPETGLALHGRILEHSAAALGRLPEAACGRLRLCGYEPPESEVGGGDGGGGGGSWGFL